MFGNPFLPGQGPLHQHGRGRPAKGAAGASARVSNPGVSASGLLIFFLVACGEREVGHHSRFIRLQSLGLVENEGRELGTGV